MLKHSHAYREASCIGRCMWKPMSTGLRNTTAYTAWVTDFNKKIKEGQVDFGVAVLDINNLKKANDEYGHKSGDELILTASKVISGVFKRSPVFRIGGDEFVVILQNNDFENRESLFEQFKSNCANTFIEEGNVKIPIRIAWGFAKFDSSVDTNFTDVFKRADDAMYENKRKTKEINKFDNE